jgi:acetylornithine deacetylase/succinyl-diaminopimelate desuccinylase-like protein
MDDRHDALAAAAELVLAVESAAREEPAETVATVGTIEITPGAVSVIPGTARLGIDARAISGPSLDRLEAAIRRSASEIAERRGVMVDIELIRAGEAVALDHGLVDSGVRAARELGIAAARTWSGSGHDAQHLAAMFPTLLVFVPLHGGESHTPQEGADMDEIIDAAQVVAEVLTGAAQESRGWFVRP